MREILKQKFETYGYKYSENSDELIVDLGHSQMIYIKLSTKDKFLISDKLVGWNFLTGLIEMSFKKAMVYNTVILILCALIFMSMHQMSMSLNFVFIFLTLSIWTTIWSLYYLIKSENFKSQVMNWIDANI